MTLLEDFLANIKDTYPAVIAESRKMKLVAKVCVAQRAESYGVMFVVEDTVGEIYAGENLVAAAKVFCECMANPMKRWEKTGQDKQKEGR